MLKELKVGTKLIAGFAIVCVLGAAVAGIGIFNLGKVNDMAGQMYERELLGLSHIKEANINLIYIGRARGNVLLSATPEEREKNIANIAKYIAAAEAYIDKAEPLFVTQKAHDMFADYARRFADYRRSVQRTIELSAGTAVAERSPELNAALTEARAQANVLDDMLSELSAMKEVRAKEAADATEATYADARSLMIVLTVCSALGGLLIGVLITRDLTGQLGGEPRYAAAIAESVAAGDLSIDIAVKPNDEHSLLAAMKKMRDSLATIVQQVRSGTETIATASSQVASGSQDLSGRTEQQASALEETASSMEEMTSAVRQNTESSAQASEMAEQAARVAKAGGEVVQRVVGTMAEIQACAVQIADITTVIDGIAFQTNILALNAAVEAARAGDQGRGFAVVANEVRTLAQRSAAAAKQIKQLINDSNEKVQAGTQLVGEAGDTMRGILGSVQGVSSVVAEIALASREQASGIEQINQAVTHMDETTQQNAALVEEAAAAADAMQQEAARLAEAVSVFRLAADASAQTVTVRHAPRQAQRRSAGETAIVALAA